MGTPGSTPDTTREEIRDLFSRSSQPAKPVSAAEIAEKLGCTRAAAEDELAALTDRGELRTTTVNGTTKVWWQPRKRAASQQPGREQFGAFVDAVKDYAIFMLDPDGTVASWNDGAERIKGYERDEIVGEHVSTFYTESDIDEGVPERNLETAAKAGRVEDEGWRLRNDGSRFWANVTITAIRDDDGTLRGFTKVTRDMTERREYEQRLRQERDLTERILETAPTSIGVIDSDGRFVRANPRMLERHGIDESDLSEYSLTALDVYDADGESIPMDEWPWRRVVETGDPVDDFRCQVDPPHGDRRWLSINAAPLEDGSGEDDLTVAAIDDITEQIERERQLRRERDQTEQLLRTAPVAIAVQDLEGNTVMANHRAQEALGLSEQEIIEEPEDGDEWRIYDTNGDSLPAEETPSARVLATGDPVFDEELVFDPPDGERMYFRVNAAPIFGSDGSVERVVTAGENITELKRRERQLEQRKVELETELSEILGRISDAFYALDEEWRFTHLNEQAAELMQASKDELLGREVWELFPDARGSVYWEKFRTAMDTQEPVTFEVFAEDLDAWLEFTAYPSESGLSIYFQDVSDRKRRERALERYKTVFETVDDGIYILGPDFRFEAVNDAYASMTGYDPAELLGSHCSQVIGEDASSEAADLARKLESGERESAILEADVITADGDRIPGESKFTALPSPDGAFQGSVGVVRDLTERKEYERELEKRARQEKVVAHLGRLALDHDDLDSLMDRACRLVSETLEVEYCKVLDLDEGSEELLLRRGVGWRPGIVGNAAVDATENSQAGYTLLSEEPVVVDDLESETRFTGPELLATHDVKSGISVVIGSVENPWGILGTHDTARRSFTEEDVNFVQSVAHILMTAIERDQYEAELTETVEELKESNERLEQFAYLSSHDLQEPLRMISNYLQLLDDQYRGELDDDAREFIDYAVDAADRMREMIEDLLAYSRVESHAEPFEPTDCNAVVDRVRERLQLQIEENDAELVVGDLPTIVADDNQLEQVFQNLISNAIKYRSDAPPRIEIDATKREGEWLFRVEDNGIGIDPAYTEQIFEVFKRLHTHDAYQGTGIGLALCKKIIDRHDGRIWVESGDGGGSAFFFTVSTEEVCQT